MCFVSPLTNIREDVTHIIRLAIKITTIVTFEKACKIEHCDYGFHFRTYWMALMRAEIIRNCTKCIMIYFKG